ncbi:MAG: dihydroneopterin aldolase [Chloroflexota bacterium]
MQESFADEVFLEGLEFFGYHGVNPEERENGQRFIVDVTLTADLATAGRTDALEDTINYSDVYQRVRALVEGPPFDLIESVAERVAETLLREFSTDSVQVTVRKPDVKLGGESVKLEAAGVTIHRVANPEEWSGV